MAEITKAVQGISSILPPAANQHSNMKAGEDLADLDAVYIKSDGLLWKATGAAANAASLAIGVTMFTKTGESAPVFHGVTVKYGTGLTPGARLYVSGTVPGGLADAVSTGGTVPFAIVIDATRIYILQPTR